MTWDDDAQTVGPWILSWTRSSLDFMVAGAVEFVLGTLRGRVVGQVNGERLMNMGFWRWLRSSEKS